MASGDVVLEVTRLQILGNASQSWLNGVEYDYKLSLVNQTTGEPPDYTTERDLKVDLQGHRFGSTELPGFDPSKKYKMTITEV